MPSYDFRCTVCSVVHEVTRPGTDDSVVVRPDCGGATKRIFTPVGVHFKGSGFHNTDNRRAEKTVDAPACPAADAGGGCAGCPAAE